MAGWTSSCDGPGSGQVGLLLSVWLGYWDMPVRQYPVLGHWGLAPLCSFVLIEMGLCWSDCSPVMPGQERCLGAKFPLLGYWGFPACHVVDDSLIAQSNRNITNAGSLLVNQSQRWVLAAKKIQIRELAEHYFCRKTAHPQPSLQLRGGEAN